jgi:hypothetical protein
VADVLVCFGGEAMIATLRAKQVQMRVPAFWADAAFKMAAAC